MIHRSNLCVVILTVVIRAMWMVVEPVHGYLNIFIDQQEMQKLMGEFLVPVYFANWALVVM